MTILKDIKIYSTTKQETRSQETRSAFSARTAQPATRFLSKWDRVEGSGFCHPPHLTLGRLLCILLMDFKRFWTLGSTTPNSLVSQSVTDTNICLSSSSLTSQRASNTYGHSHYMQLKSRSIALFTFLSQASSISHFSTDSPQFNSCNNFPESSDKSLKKWILWVED